MNKACSLECPVCGGKVSSAAKSCPHCGHPMKESLVAKQFKTVADQTKMAAQDVKDAMYEGIVDNPDKIYRGYVISAIGHIVLTWLTAFAIVMVFGAIGLTFVGSMAILTACAMTCKMFPTRERYAKDIEKDTQQEGTSSESSELSKPTTSIESEETICDICGKHGLNKRVMLKIERRKVFDWTRKEIAVAVCEDCRREIRSRPMCVFKFFLKSLFLCVLVCVLAGYVFAYAIELKEIVHGMSLAFGALAGGLISVIVIILANPNRGKKSYMDTRQMRKLQHDDWEIVDVEE